MSGARPITERMAALLLAPLAYARAEIPGLEVTELSGDEGLAQWHLATALQRCKEPDFQNTLPIWEVQ